MTKHEYAVELRKLRERMRQPGYMVMVDDVDLIARAADRLDVGTRDEYGRTAQDRYDDECIERYGRVELDNDLNY